MARARSIALRAGRWPRRLPGSSSPRRPHAQRQGTPRRSVGGIGQPPSCGARHRVCARDAASAYRAPPAGMAIGQSADRPIAAEICCLDQIRGIVRILRQRQRDAIEGVQWPSASSTPLLARPSRTWAALRAPSGPSGPGWVPAPRPSTALTTAGVTRRPPHQGASVGVSWGCQREWCAGCRRWGDALARKSAGVGEMEQVPRMGSCGGEG